MLGIIVAGDVIGCLVLRMDEYGPHGTGRLVVHVHTMGFEYMQASISDT